ncbi:MALT paracaspase 2 isoform X1 [Erpetoichthys calabaricus]|uniref:MALT paracaspase 2 isoform X1 n=2 Tax=Erpetoichthys calabaricus TaxID=27687 RepID=UPI00109F70D9|nr:MALT paracaspase 2 isoform X1 [Erpetoichthys calabaricus]XP_028672122.1 MALT paracaspase 2 isoform X1 [Erpetoichthys calabaricus]
MADPGLLLRDLDKGTLNRLADILDNTVCGWKKLARTVSSEPRFRFSDKELDSCSLQVLSPEGSPSRRLLGLLSDRACSVGFLLRCLQATEHTEATQYLTHVVMESIRVVQQPQPQSGLEGSRISLSCKAEGPPSLSYQWFKGKDEVTGATASELCLGPLIAQDQGHYICRIHLGDQCVFSQWALVQVIRADSPTPAGGFQPSVTSGLYIQKQPTSHSLCEGDVLVLECVAFGNPPPQYQWYCNKASLPQEKHTRLRINSVTTADRGQYRCRVYNLFQELWSEEVLVEIGPSLSNGPLWGEEQEEPDIGFQASKEKLQCHFYATDKVALLIGNMNYKFHRRLQAPMADVHELANLLRQLDFKVVSLLDLNHREMQCAVREFLLLLDRGVYGLLYYAGHGYENFGNSFMVPIDAPSSYTLDHCLWVQEILHQMQERQTGLNIFLLDMCRKRNMNDEVIPRPGTLKVTANIVFGYATCADAEAYEVCKGNLSNGIFMDFLKQRLLENEKVTVMLDKVAEDMGRCPIARGRQALELRSNLSERRTLSDPIKLLNCEEEYSARTLQWSIAHVLPDSRLLTFECGVRVQLGFAAEFSNIMIIFTRILEKPKNLTLCEARITDLSEDMDIDIKMTNKESPEDTGSLLITLDSFQFPESSSLYTRLCGLQKLQRDLSFTVCLQYQYQEMDEFVEEKKTVSIGKPLVAKLGLHRCPPPPSPLSAPSELQSPDWGFRGSSSSSLGSESTCWSYYSNPGELSCPTTPGTMSLPEETLLERPLPLSENPQDLTSGARYSCDNVNDISVHFQNKMNFSSC